jgi:hypothetical protein
MKNEITNETTVGHIQALRDQFGISVISVFAISDKWTVKVTKPNGDELSATRNSLVDAMNASLGEVTK